MSLCAIKQTSYDSNVTFHSKNSKFITRNKPQRDMQGCEFVNFWWKISGNLF